MEFRYRAIAGDGSRVDGTVTAANRAAAQKRLQSQHATVLNLELISAESEPKALRVKPESIVSFFRRMSVMVNSGVSWSDALEFLAASEADPKMEEAAELVCKLVQEGHALSTAMKHHRLRRTFDSVCVGLVALGEQTGELNRILGKIADLKERQLELTRAFLSALTYPAVLFLAIIGLGLLFTTILGPGDEGLFAAFGQEMPWPTIVVQNISQAIRNPFLMGGLLVAVLTFILTFRHVLSTNDTFRLRVHATLLNLPAVGRLIRKIECARILYVLSDSLTVGLPLARALLMAREVCGNERVKLEITKVHREFTDGSDISTALANHDLFPQMVLCMVESGLETGKLDAVLEQASKTFEDDVKLALDSVAQLAEPIMLIFAGLMAGFLALATLMPIIQMVDSL